MGRNNKRMKSEMLAKIKMQYQQQQVTIAISTTTGNNTTAPRYAVMGYVTVL